MNQLPDNNAGKRLTFRKPERLHHRTLVENLFAHGRSMYEWPLRMTWLVMDEAVLAGSFRRGVPDGIGKVQMLVTIPKRKRRRAVDRVLMRRRVREAYRLHRLPLIEAVTSNPEIRTVQMAFVYMADKNVDYKLVSARMKKLLDKLIVNITNNITEDK